jgi:murein DD-endopeptidase MepM/ murein hydrolase activator NlpD
VVIESKTSDGRPFTMRYMHNEADASIKEGQFLRAGTQIGATTTPTAPGMTGNHLHLEFHPVQVSTVRYSWPTAVDPRYLLSRWL